MGNAAAEPQCTGDFIGMGEFVKERTVDDFCPGAVSDIADNHGGILSNRYVGITGQ